MLDEIDLNFTMACVGSRLSVWSKTHLGYGFGGRMADSPGSPRVKGSINGGGSEFMFAAEISFERTGLLHVDDRTNALGKVSRRATLFEIGPIRDGHEPNLFQLGFAVLLPEATSVKMSIECKNKGTYWVLHGLPLFWPLVTRETYPGLGPAEQRLGIRGLSVANLKRVPWQQSVGISNLPRRHGGRA